MDNAETEEGLATVINAYSPKAMAQACETLNIPLVHLSTDYVFDGTSDKPWQPKDATKPINAYGRVKKKEKKVFAPWVLHMVFYGRPGLFHLMVPIS